MRVRKGETIRDHIKNITDSSVLSMGLSFTWLYTLSNLISSVCVIDLHTQLECLANQKHFIDKRCR